MADTITSVWELSTNKVCEIHFSEKLNMDAITNRLPQGYYTTFRTYGGGKRVLGLSPHLKRLYQPAKRQGIRPAVSEKALREQMRMHLAGYSSEARIRLILAENGTLYVMLMPLILYPPEVYQRGVRAITTNIKRENPQLKLTTFISKSAKKRTQIAKSDVFEALIVKNSTILEGITSNFFYVQKGVLGTAGAGVLPGVTRKTVLQIARESGVGVVTRALKREQVQALSEAFLTSSSRGVVPIIQIDEIRVGEGVPGLITKQLIEYYQDYVQNHAENI